MPELPIALQIVQAVVERLQTIAVADGFHTDAGASVKVGWLSQDPPALGLGVYGRAETAALEPNKTRFNARMDIVCEARVPTPAGDEDGTMLEKVIADIQKAVEDPVHRNLGGLAIGGVNYKGRDVAGPPKPPLGSPIAWAWLTYQVVYHRKFGDPASRA